MTNPTPNTPEAAAARLKAWDKLHRCLRSPLAGGFGVSPNTLESAFSDGWHEYLSCSPYEPMRAASRTPPPPCPAREVIQELLHEAGYDVDGRQAHDKIPPAVVQKICARLHIEPEPPPAPSKPSLYTRLGEAQSAELVEECQRMYEVVPDKRAALGEELRRRLAIAAPRAGGSVEAVYIQQRVTGQDVVDAAYRGYRRVAGEPIGEPQYQPYHLAPGQMLDDAKRFSNTALVEALVRPESYDRNERYALVGELHRRLGKLA